MRRTLFLCSFIIAIVACNSKKSQMTFSLNDPDPRWARVDSLENIGQYGSALEATDSIATASRTTGDWRNEFRALKQRARYQQYTGIEADAITAQLDQRTATATYPLKQLLHSALAERWWNRYQQERWQILDRTNADATSASGDPATWSQQQFMDKVIVEFRASLEPVDSLIATPAGELGRLLIGGDNALLRPTLFDILAHRALEVFRNTETRLTEPAWAFKLSDPRTFSLFETFANKPFAHRDSTSWEFQALRHYQRLEMLHLGDAKPDALVDVTLERLAFVRERSTLANKDSLYLNALNTLNTRLPNDTCEAEVAHAIATWHADQGTSLTRDGGDAWKWEKKKAVELCDAAIAKFPGSFGAKNCTALKARLMVSSLQVITEEAVLPDAPFRIALEYANTKQVWLRVIADKVTINANPPQDREDWLLKQKAIKEWTVELPDDGDLNSHLIELPVAGLPYGHYTVLVSSASTFKRRTDVISYASFWSARLSLSQRNKGSEVDLLVLDRGTGVPIPNVVARYHVRNYGANNGDRFIGSALFSTDTEGALHVSIVPTEGQVIWSLTKDNDEYISDVQWMYDPGTATPGPELRTFLFTDRAIYRPGQPIEFKGIATARKDKVTEVLANKKTQVRLFDTNGELVDSLNVTSDAYGSFKGRFTAPGGLTGSMRIEEENGSQGFQVEEYKRPTFEVVFVPVTAAPKLEQQAEVSGMAKSYAGVPLDGAQVQWTVKRSARMPWWCGWGWRGFPGWGRETEIASGTATTDAAGKFTVKFTATADPSLPREADPTFSYSVEASIIDINGETQSSSTNLNVGYRSIDIALNVGNSIDRNTTDSLDVRIQNLNGQDVDVPMDVRISELVVPDSVPEVERLWAEPDRVLAGEPALVPH
ncbi:MAG: MG2 domain-containing protein, partial [Flavobacteriales bacterium]